MKRHLKYVTLIVVICCIFLSACSGKPSSTQDDSKKGSENEQSDDSSNNVSQDDYNSNINEPGVYPVCKERIELRVGIVQDSNVEDYETNYLTEIYKEKTNIDLLFDVYPNAEAEQKLQVMVASQSELPEVITGIKLSDMTVLSFSDQGAIIPLNDLIEKYGFHLKNAFENSPQLKTYTTMPDGKIYSIAKYTETIGNLWSGRATINKKWLDNVGLDIPKTTDEF